MVIIDTSTDNLVAASMWTNLEPSIAVFVACLPVMRPLLHPREFWARRTHTEIEEHELDKQDSGHRKKAKVAR